MSSPQTLEALRSGQYKGTKKLKLSADFSYFPPEILSLFETLEVLDLSNNPLSDLPNDFSRLHKLKILFLTDCNFATFPSQLAKCRSLEMIAFKNNHMTTIPEGSFPRKLRWLILTNNKINSLPASIGQCHRLQKCMLAGNRLSSLPAEMANCRKLSLLRLSSNNLRSLPDWLFQLPELSFLSFAGNPCASSFAGNPALESIPWSSLAVHQLLGEGASGVISKGFWKAPDGDREVAIKVFKGELTSDGSPSDEMSACIAAGQHPNLIDPIGKIHGHPEKKGLVLQLIPPHYTNLGFPPDFSTCTRDNFPPSVVFSAEKCRSVLLGVADAMRHIHERGIAHGDLYAHNTLVDEDGHALLGDFGAATIYGNGEEKDAIERMEVLAFGHLVEDLVGLVEHRVDGDEVLGEKDGYVIEGLNALHYRCTNPIVLERPDFEEVVDLLNGL